MLASNSKSQVTLSLRGNFIPKEWISYLEHSDEGLRKAVKGTAGFGLVWKVKLPSKNLHAQQGEDDDEEEKEQQ